MHNRADAGGTAADRAGPAPPCIMVMGPSGVGKSSLARALARRIGARFIEGDDYHPPENRAAMAAGRPLTDDMRWPWLRALADAVAASHACGPTVFACSALKRSYRDLLRDRIGHDLRLICLHAPPELILSRMRARQHYMPPALLASQLATLEMPTDDEAPVMLDMTAPLDLIVERAVTALKSV